jgi:hypothetical protein
MFQNPGSIVVEARQRELRYEADQNRLARLAKGSRMVASERNTPVVRGFMLRLGRLVAAR